MTTATTPAQRTFLRIPLNEWLRKAVHMGAFGAAFLLPHLTPKQAALMAIGALLFNMFVLPKLMPSIIRREGNSGYLEILMYPAAVLAIVLALGIDTPDLYCGDHCPTTDAPNYFQPVMTVWFILAIGDGLLGIAHSFFKTHRKVPWNSRKSLLGILTGTCAISLIVVLGILIREVLKAEPVYSSLLDYIPKEISFYVLLLTSVLAISIWESIWLGIADNITLPFLVSLAIAFFLIDNPGSDYWPQRVHLKLYTFIIPAVFGLAAWTAKKVTTGGAVFGCGTAIVLMIAQPWLFLFLCLFFALGVVATKYKFNEKERWGIAESRQGRRGVAEIFGASGVMTWLCTLALIKDFPENGAAKLPFLIIISPLIAKTMDTVSSEMGKAIGGTTISLRSFKRVAPGTDGGVSLAGTLWGFAAAAALAALILPLHWGGLKEVGILVAIALLANLFESYWAAWAAPRGVNDGPHTNFMMTLFAATLAWFWWM